MCRSFTEVTSAWMDKNVPFDKRKRDFYVNIYPLESLSELNKISMNQVYSNDVKLAWI